MIWTILIVCAMAWAVMKGAARAKRAVGDYYRSRRDGWRDDHATIRSAVADGKPVTGATSGRKAAAAIATVGVGGVLATRGFVEGWRAGWPQGKQRGWEWVKCRRGLAGLEPAADTPDARPVARAQAAPESESGCLYRVSVSDANGNRIDPLCGAPRLPGLDYCEAHTPLPDPIDGPTQVGCLWDVGDPAVSPFVQHCGEPRVDSSPYCSQHRDRFEAESLEAQRPPDLPPLIVARHELAPCADRVQGEQGRPPADCGRCVNNRIGQMVCMYAKPNSLDARLAEPEHDDKPRLSVVPNPSTENPEEDSMIETVTGGEVYSMVQLAAELDAIRVEAAAEVEDAQGDRVRTAAELDDAQKDATRAAAEIARNDQVTARMRELELDGASLGELASLQGTNAARVDLAKRRVNVADQRLALANQRVSAAEQRWRSADHALAALTRHQPVQDARDGVANGGAKTEFYKEV